MRPSADPPSPIVPRGTVGVGGLPQYAAYDPADGEIYVPNWANSNVSVLFGNHVVATLPAGLIPFSAAYDPTTQCIYIVNEASNNLTVINGTTIVGSVPVGSTPQFATFDGGNGYMYVSNYGSGSVTVVSGLARIGTVYVGLHPGRPTAGGSAGGGGGGGGWLPALHASPSTSTGLVYVPNAGSNNVSIIGGSTGLQVVASVFVGTSPQFGTWDPSNVWYYVANNNSSNVSVLSDASPYEVLYTVDVGTNPYSAAYNASTKEVFVVNYGSNNVSVLGGALTNQVVASVPVGRGPLFVAQDPPPWNALVVPNSLSNNVSVIVGTSVVGSFPAGTMPVIGTVDPLTGYVYVQNFESSNVTLLGPPPPTVTVKFLAVGLPAGSPWSVTAGAPPVSYHNTTVGARGLIPVGTRQGNFPYSLSGPAGWGVERISGVGAPSQTGATITGNVTFVVLFGRIETVFFNETGLANGAVWGITVHSPLAHGGPMAPPEGTATVSGAIGTSINFSLVQGSWLFVVAHPTNYSPLPPRGLFAVPAHVLTRLEHFRLITSAVVFSERGLLAGTRWGVNVTGPMNVKVNGTGASFRLLLENGSYSFVVWSVKGATASPTSGSFVVSAPHPVSEPIVYTRGGAIPAILPPTETPPVLLARARGPL